jgi:hypothetical protein
MDPEDGMMMQFLICSLLTEARICGDQREVEVDSAVHNGRNGCSIAGEALSTGKFI